MSYIHICNTCSSTFLIHFKHDLYFSVFQAAEVHLPHIKTHLILKVAPHVNGYGRYIFCSIVGNFEGMIADSNLTLTIQALKWLKSALAGKRGVIWDAEEINLKVVKCGVAENLLYRCQSDHRPTVPKHMEHTIWG